MTMLIFSKCGLGATFESHMSSDLPKPLPKYFASRAKAILEIELDEPQVATVQGLAMLSSYEAAATRDTRAWVFSGQIALYKPVAVDMYADLLRSLGMAIRLALTLGLHISTRKYVEEGKMTAVEANARNVTMWGSFLNDWCVVYILFGNLQGNG